MASSADQKTSDERALLAVRLRAEVVPGESHRCGDDQRTGQHHQGGDAIGPERDAERRVPAADDIDERLAACPHTSRQPRGRAMTICKASTAAAATRGPPTTQHDSAMMPAAGRTIASTSSLPPGVGSEPARACSGITARHPASPVRLEAGTAGVRVQSQQQATAIAVAEKATTMPVITSACGTGSPPGQRQHRASRSRRRGGTRRSPAD